MNKCIKSEKVSATIGLDLGDKTHYYCVLDEEGEIVDEGKISSTVKCVKSFFVDRESSVVAMEAGTQSPWISRLLESYGHKVLVANPRKLKMIYASMAKSDQRDAQMLARIARFDPSLLSPIKHRGPQAQSDLAVIKSRDSLVRARASQINFMRGIVKSVGHRLPSSSSPAFHKKVKAEIPRGLRPALYPVLSIIERLTEQIETMDKEIARLGEQEYPETQKLRGIKGVGPITSLAFVLTLEEKTRFVKSRSVGAYLGLTPRRDQSGQIDKQLRITKAGDHYLRTLLVSCAHYILGPFGPACNLRSFGERLSARGGKNAKKRAIVAVARKLAVVMHTLWVNDAEYDPFYKAVNPNKREKIIQSKAA